MCLSAATLQSWQAPTSSALSSSLVVGGTSIRTLVKAHAASNTVAFFDEVASFAAASVLISAAQGHKCWWSACQLEMKHASEQNVVPQRHRKGMAGIARLHLLFPQVIAMAPHRKYCTLDADEG